MEDSISASNFNTSNRELKNYDVFEFQIYIEKIILSEFGSKNIHDKN